MELAAPTPGPELRPATNADAPAARALVFTSLAEHGLRPDPGGTDADLDDLAANYHGRGGDFVVLVDDGGRVVGTCGLYPLGEGGVELRKMYLAPPLRGRGQGKRLLAWALGRARELGFRRLELETAQVLKSAIALYERAGFRRACGQPNAGRCDTRYVLDL